MRVVRIRGARQHNLKNLDLDIPRDQLVVVTGVSGSGKSTLAFDTLYAEGQRRYVESLSVYTRQFLERLPKPQIESIEGLSPAIAIDQKAAVLNPRSTVGTVTEIYDFLRLLYARIGTAHCPICDHPVTSQTIDQMVDQLLTYPEGTLLIILAPLVRSTKGNHEALINRLKREGYARLRINGRIQEIDASGPLPEHEVHTIEAVIDRLAVSKPLRNRLADSLELALSLSEGTVLVDLPEVRQSKAYSPLHFSLRAICPTCTQQMPEFSPAWFSFNSSQGACPECAGTGVKAEEKQSGGRLRKFMTPCSACQGTRLRSEARAVRIDRMAIHHVTALPVNRALVALRQLRLNDHQSLMAGRVIHELVQRLEFLQDVGLSYLSLDRSTHSLSGGELQRIRLATQIGARLTGVLYILDEPSVGLHPKDHRMLLQTLLRMRDMGNTVLVVEHDRETIQAADYVIELGPGAGTQGGRIVFSGPPAALLASNTLTGQYMSGRLKITTPPVRRSGNGKFIRISGARQHNLKDIQVEFKLGCLTCVTGVSGSGKSTLVIDTLYRALTRRFRGASSPEAVQYGVINGLEHVDNAINIDQAPIGRTPRSNPATYVGLFNFVRELYAKTPEARMRGYSPGRFSFNARGGRCEACRGEGMVKVEMVFLPDLYVPCDACRKRRFNRETLEIRFKGHTIADVLEMTVDQALQVFDFFPAIRERLQALADVGLGYIQLGQPGTTLSGGEAQRIKLARELGKRESGRTLYLLDEPTTGLHLHDIDYLMRVLNRLVDAGNSVIMIEHNLDVIKTADQIIDLGPDGGEHGGYVIGAGTPEQIAALERSYTGRFLAAALTTNTKRPFS